MQMIVGVEYEDVGSQLEARRNNLSFGITNWCALRPRERARRAMRSHDSAAGSLELVRVAPPDWHRTSQGPTA